MSMNDDMWREKWNRTNVERIQAVIEVQELKGELRKILEFATEPVSVTSTGATADPVTADYMRRAVASVLAEVAGMAEEALGLSKISYDRVHKEVGRSRAAKVGKAKKNPADDYHD